MAHSAHAGWSSSKTALKSHAQNVREKQQEEMCEMRLERAIVDNVQNRDFYGLSAMQLLT